MEPPRSRSTGPRRISGATAVRGGTPASPARRGRAPTAAGERRRRCPWRGKGAHLLDLALASPSACRRSWIGALPQGPDLDREEGRGRRDGGRRLGPAGGWDGGSPQTPRECSTDPCLLHFAAPVAAPAGAATVHFRSAFCRCSCLCSICWRQSYDPFASLAAAGPHDRGLADAEHHARRLTVAEPSARRPHARPCAVPSLRRLAKARRSTPRPIRLHAGHDRSVHLRRSVYAPAADPVVSSDTIMECKRMGSIDFIGYIFIGLLITCESHNATHTCSHTTPTLLQQSCLCNMCPTCMQNAAFIAFCCSLMQNATM
jgi:hypothetical protein